MTTNNDRPSFTFTTFNASKGTNLNKIYTLQDDAITKTVPANLYKGTYEVYEQSDLNKFNNSLNNLSANHALSIGVPKEATKGDIVSREDEQNNEDGISRTKDNFKFSDCLIFDIDNSSLKIDEVIPELCKIDPSLATANLLVRSSSSYGISKSDEPPNDQACGYHVWVCGVKDPEDIERYGKVFAQRCWLAGMGEIQLSTTGAMLVRQLIDDSVFSPERLVFEAAPTLGEGIIQSEPQHYIQQGILLDTSLLASLNVKEQHKYKSLINIAKQEVISESEKVKQSYIKHRVKEAVKKGIDEDTALRHVNASLDSGGLYGTHLLYFTHKTGSVTVDEVLADMNEYDGKTLADPMEPDYNNSYTVAKFYANEDSKNPLVRSFAHGTGKTYRLKCDLDKVKSNTGFNATLDRENKYHQIDLLKHIDDNHILKRMAIEVGKVASLPYSTVLMVGMGVYAAMAARKYVVSYPDGTPLPLGLYIVVEQPSGTGKSRCLRYFQQPFSEHQKSRSKELKILLNNDADDELLKAQLDALTPSFGLTNATPEGLEVTLSQTNGYFSAVSSEQGLFNSLLVGAYLSKGQVSNNDAVLNGFDGGHVACSRVSRKGYVGNVVGGIVSFAQHGSIETLLDAANGSGLSERFLMVAEPHELGNRTHSAKPKVDQQLLDQYKTCCADILPALELASEIGALTQIRLTENGFSLIASFQNSIEPHLADGAKYSYAALRGAASKANMQIMKVAAVLHLLGDAALTPEEQQSGNNIVVDDQYVEAAIQIVNDLLEASLTLCNMKGITGDKAEFEAILSMYDRNNTPKSERYIVKSKTKTHPFRNFTGNKSQKVRDALGLMVEQNILSVSVDDGKKMYSMAQ